MSKQRPYPPINERLAHLVGNELYADFHFIIEEDDNRRIPAHKLIVAAGSEELCKIVHGTQHLHGVADNSTKVGEISADAFIEILRYLYTDQINLAVDNVFDILKKANYYGLPLLQQKCVEMLSANLTSDSCLPVYAQLYSLAPFPELVRHCLRAIRYSPQRYAFEHASWPDVEPAAVRQILESNAINCDDEALYGALISWARQRCERRTGVTVGDAAVVGVPELRAEVGDLCECIRWGTMQVEAFDRCVQLVPGFFSERQVHEMRMRCDSAARRRQYLTCQDCHWLKSSESEDIHPGAVYVGLNRRYSPHYVGRAFNAALGTWTVKNVKQTSTQDGKRHEVLLGEGYEWVPYERATDIPYGAVVLTTPTTDKDTDDADEADPQFVGRTSDGRLVVIDWYREEIIHEDGGRKACSNFEVLVGRNVLAVHDRDSEVPPDALRLGAVGPSGQPLYLGRAFFGTDLLPARIDPGERIAYVPFACAEHRVHQYVYARGLLDAVQWQPSSDGAILPLAVAGGRTISNETLYVSRVPAPRQQAGGDASSAVEAAGSSEGEEERRSWLVGNVHPSHRTMYAGLDGTEAGFTQYEIMVWTDASRATQNPQHQDLHFHDVYYDDEAAEDVYEIDYSEDSDDE